MSKPNPMPPSPGELSRRGFLALSGGAIAGLALPGTAAAAATVAPKPLFPQLGRIGERFTFGLIADTHFGPLVGESRLQANAAKFQRVAGEINALQPAPAFVVHVGDVIANPSPACVTASKTLVHELKPLTVLVHGNHDGHKPWSEFKEMQRAANGTEEVMFSFDCGRWHFVVFPFNEGPSAEFSDTLIVWLAADLRAHGGRPTMVFEHHHLLPQGLTQLESYTYDKALRTRILQTLAAAGNVRWVFCGHVHNGIQAAVKTAWTWRGINFLTVPTVVPPRNFGEEYPAFAAGQTSNENNGGGYYLLADVDGENVRIRGRLVGTAEDFVFSDTFRAYENQEPLWFDDITDLPARPALENGSFEQELTGWMRPYRYIADRDPGFGWSAGSAQAKSGRRAAHLFVREKGQPWARDEMMELYQWVRLPAGGAPLVRASYFVEKPDVRGGGYMRFTAFAKNAPKLTYLFDWGGGDRERNMRMALHAQFMARGEKAKATALLELGRRREAMFWRLPATPGRWHGLHVQLQSACDQALGQPGAFQRLGIDRLLVAVGVWCGEQPGSRSSAWFDDLTLATTPEAPPASAAIVFNGAPVPVTASVFETDFGAGRGPGGDAPDEARGRKGKRL